MKSLSAPVLLLAVAVLSAQTPTKKQKEEGFVIAPILFKDPACARDFLKANTLEGLEGRKMLAELIQYGCLQKMEGIYHVDVTDTKPIGTGPKPSLAKHVLLILDIDNTSKMIHRNADTTTAFADGWILAESILHITDQDLDELVAKRAESRSQ